MTVCLEKMRITIISVGKIKESFYREALAEYVKRLSKYCKLEIIEVPDEKTPDNASDNVCNQIMEKEAARIKGKLPENAYIIATAIEGKKYDSVGFSKLINNLGIRGESHIVFLIGGSLGIHPDLKEKADLLISFSDMTFPHQLMRVILTEQIYRAFRITNGEPYHK